MKNEEPRVALQAIEFWSTVCEEEIELAADMAEVLSFLLSNFTSRATLLCVCLGF